MTQIPFFRAWMVDDTCNITFEPGVPVVLQRWFANALADRMSWAPQSIEVNAKEMLTDMAERGTLAKRDDRWIWSEPLVRLCDVNRLSGNFIKVARVKAAMAKQEPSAEVEDAMRKLEEIMGMLTTVTVDTE